MKRCIYLFGLAIVISFALASLPAEAEDADLDGMDDDWERAHGLDPQTPDASLDPDRDNLTNIYEFFANTDPQDADSDDDGLNDGCEVNLAKSDPNLVDTDSDGLIDSAEYLTYHTNARANDTDGDGLNDLVEIARGSDPRNSDTDGDGIIDGLEVNSDPIKKDTDGDGLNDSEEAAYRTNPCMPDTDGDGLTDGEEVKVIGSDPLLYDSDSDGLSDAFEVERGLDPNRKDTDGGGVPDGVEIANGLDAKDASDDGSIALWKNVPIVISLIAICISVASLIVAFSIRRRAQPHAREHEMMNKATLETPVEQKAVMKEPLKVPQRPASQVAITDDAPDVLGAQPKRAEVPKDEPAILIVDSLKRTAEDACDRPPYLDERRRVLPSPRSADADANMSFDDIMNLKVEKKR